MNIEKKRNLILIIKELREVERDLNALGIDSFGRDFTAITRGIIGAITNEETNELYDKLIGGK